MIFQSCELSQWPGEVQENDEDFGGPALSTVVCYMSWMVGHLCLFFSAVYLFWTVDLLILMSAFLLCATQHYI